MSAVYRVPFLITREAADALAGAALDEADRIHEMPEEEDPDYPRMRRLRELAFLFEGMVTGIADGTIQPENVGWAYERP